MRARIRYHAGKSLCHRLYPLVKLSWLIFGTVFVFIVRQPWAILGVVGLALLIFGLSRLPLARLRGARLLATTALALFLVQAAFIRRGEILWTLGGFQLTTGGLETGTYVAGRFLAVVLLSYLFVLTTEPNALAYALMQAGLPYRLGFTFITALRLVPVFEQEGQIVYQAQLARGIAYDGRSARRFLVLARQFFLPLLISALSKVDSLSVSMEGRCFGKYPQRTFLREVRPQMYDWIALVLLALAIGFTALYVSRGATL